MMPEGLGIDTWTHNPGIGKATSLVKNNVSAKTNTLDTHGTADVSEH